MRFTVAEFTYYKTVTCSILNLVLNHNPKRSQIKSKIMIKISHYNQDKLNKIQSL